jgi:predicted transcriptional regulator
MAKSAGGGAEVQTIELLRHLLAIELWRGGLSQQQIRKRLGISINAVNAMLKGVSRTITHESSE